MIDLDLDPDSYQSAFCVTTDRNSQRLLEQDARPVVLAADALLSRQHTFPGRDRLGRTFFLPTIVTTASLYTFRYEPTEVSLETGSFDKVNPNEIEPIPWIRFHKTLTVHSARARTVFVVNAASLPKFLDVISQGFGYPVT